jgi:hypothetical protein
MPIGIYLSKVSNFDQKSIVLYAAKYSAAFNSGQIMRQVPGGPGGRVRVAVSTRRLSLRKFLEAGLKQMLAYRALALYEFPTAPKQHQSLAASLAAGQYGRQWASER